MACGDVPAPVVASATDTTDTGTGGTSTAHEPTTGPSATDSSTGMEPAEPVCCGCLCLDPAWSCAADTCLLADGTVAELGPEAGFLAIAPHSFSYLKGSDGVVGDAAEARLWYVFQPADEAPETRPLVVFFNGGPGYSTAILFGLNTGARTADPDVAGPAVVADNPHSWTRFANLLHVDVRETGFSYDIAPLDGPRPEAPFLAEHDAAYVAQAVLMFLRRHPQIAANPVMLVGESYGGLRAALISQLLLYPDELVTSTYYRNPQLRQAVLDHFARTRPELPPGPLDPSIVAQQFGTRVLIQPVISWLVQDAGPTPPEQRPMLLQCVDLPDPMQCDEPSSWSTPYTDAAVSALLDPTTLSAMTGVDATTIAWLRPENRVGAYPRVPDDVDSSALAAEFGALAGGDVFYKPVFIRPGVPGSSWTDPRYGLALLRTLPGVRTFITDAGKDILVFAPDIPAVLAGYDTVLASAVHDPEPMGGEARPGRIRVTYRPELGLDEPVHTIRFPFYATAGHMVTIRQPGELLADIEAWFAGE